MTDSYCPKCVADGEHERTGEVQWHRQCAMTVLTVILVRRYGEPLERDSNA